jgi:uncharacterized protein YhaN
MIANGIKAAITLALLALCAGGIALFYSHLARTEAEESRHELRELERLGEFAERIREFEGDLRNVAGDAGEFFEIIDSLVSQTEDGFRRVAEQRQRMSDTVSRLGDTVRALEGRIAELEEMLYQFESQRPATAARDTPPEPVAAVESAEPAEGESEAETDGTEPRIYRIQSGDTLTRVAREFGVSLNDLMDANPDTDPNRLQIGQAIVIP